VRIERSLTGATLVLAGATLYIATLVVVERGRANIAAEQRQSLEARVHELQQERTRKAQPVSFVSSPMVATPQQAATPSPATTASADAPRRSYALLGSTLQQRLAQYTDPTTRALMLRLRREREGELNPGLRQELHISVEEENELLDLLGDQDLRNEEQEIRAAIEGRRATLDAGALDDDLDKKLNALLGPERMKRWDDYQDTLPERRAVIDLRSRLGDTDAMNDATAKQLLEALHDEREQFAAETAQLAGGPSSYNDSYPEFARLKSDDVSARLKFREEQIERTVAYFARIRERVTPLLSEQQLRRLADLQESRVANLRANLLRGRSIENEMKKLREAQAPAPAPAK
jgi:hypothetical protein